MQWKIHCEVKKKKFLVIALKIAGECFCQGFVNFDSIQPKTGKDALKELQRSIQTLASIPDEG